MNEKQQQRLTVIAFVLAGVVVTVALVLLALEENVNLFYEPERIANGTAPIATPIRGGGMVADGSIVHDEVGIGVRFVLTDYVGNDFEVYYQGLLPGLFREGEGTLVIGQLDEDRVFQADKVLTKHDEKYIPPEIHDVLEESSESADADGSGKEEVSVSDNALSVSATTSALLAQDSSE